MTLQSTGSELSIIQELTARGFENPQLLVCLAKHRVELFIGPHEDGDEAARILYENLSAGVETVGDEKRWVRSGDDYRPICLSRHVQTDAPCDEDLCMSRQRVCGLLDHPEEKIQMMLIDKELRRRPCGCIDFESFCDFLVDRGFYQGPLSNRSPDPYAYYLECQRLKQEQVDWERDFKTRWYGKYP